MSCLCVLATAVGLLLNGLTLACENGQSTNTDIRQRIRNSGQVFMNSKTHEKSLHSRVSIVGSFFMIDVL